MERTALLIRCAVDDAARVRMEAERQRRTISGYILQITLRVVDIDDRLFAKLTAFRTTNQILSRRSLMTPGARTAMLVRCNVEEAERVRVAARRRDLPINAFVLQSLKRAWAAELKPPILSAPSEEAQQMNSPR
jgi:hypothetical protein